MPLPPPHPPAQVRVQARAQVSQTRSAQAWAAVLALGREAVALRRVQEQQLMDRTALRDAPQSSGPGAAPHGAAPAPDPQAALKALRTRVRAQLAALERRAGVEPRTLLLLKGLAASLQPGQERALAEAAAGLHRHLLEAVRVQGPEHPDLLHWLEALALLHEVEGLDGRPWRERVLGIRVLRTEKPDPALEKECMEGMSASMGGFFSFFPPDEPRLLFHADLMTRLWNLRVDEQGFTALFAREGLKAVNREAWGLLARKGEPALHARIAGLLDALDAGTLAGILAGPARVCRLALDLDGTPLEASMRRLRGRLRGVLEERGDPEALYRMELSAGDLPAAAEHLKGMALALTAPRALALLGRELERRPALLEQEELRQLLCERVALLGAGSLGPVPAGPPGPETPLSPGAAEALATLLESRGLWREAEGLRGKLELALRSSGEGTSRARNLEGLALNLRAQGRLEEAENICQEWALLDPQAPGPLLLRARLLLARGRKDDAVLPAMDVYRALAGGLPEAWACRGYAELWPLLAGCPPCVPVLVQVEEQARGRAGLPEEQLRTLEGRPELLLQCMDEGRVPKTLEDPLLRSILLESAAAGRKDKEARVLLEEALVLREKVLGAEHPGLEPLVYKLLESRSDDPTAGEMATLLRRCLSLLDAGAPATAGHRFKVQVALGFLLLVMRNDGEGEGHLLRAMRLWSGLGAITAEVEDVRAEGLLPEVLASMSRLGRYAGAAAFLGELRELEAWPGAGDRLPALRRAWAELQEVFRRRALVRGRLEEAGVHLP